MRRWGGPHRPAHLPGAQRARDRHGAPPGRDRALRDALALAAPLARARGLMKPLLIMSAVLLAACGGNRAVHESLAADATIPQTSYFTGTPLADREGWYGRILREMREPVLSRERRDSLPVYRFLWIPTWYHPVVVRIEAGPNGYRLTSKSLSGAGGYDPGSLN